MCHVAGQTCTVLAALPGASYAPLVSADGTRVSFLSQTGDVSQIFTVNTDGTSLRQVTPGRAWRQELRYVGRWAHRILLVRFRSNLSTQSRHRAGRRETAVHPRVGHLVAICPKPRFGPHTERSRILGSNVGGGIVKLSCLLNLSPVFFK